MYLTRSLHTLLSKLSVKAAVLKSISRLRAFVEMLFIKAEFH